MPFDFSGQPQESEASVLKDLALAPARGAAGFAQGVYGLADILTFDSLPDWNSNPLGESKTAAGGIVQSLTQFSLGFIPIAGWVGRGGQVAGTSARLFKGVSNAAIKGSGKAGAVARTLGQGAIAGGITDFAVFDGHEGRLSDILQQYPALQNPVSEFLASDADDSQFEGRIKNVLEGAALGGFVDSLVLGIKGLKAKRNFLEAKPDATPDELEAAIDAATGGPDAHRATAFYDPEADRLRQLEEDPVGNAHLDVTSQEKALGEAEAHDYLDQGPLTDEEFEEALGSFSGTEGTLQNQVDSAFADVGTDAGRTSDELFLEERRLQNSRDPEAVDVDLDLQAQAAETVRSSGSIQRGAERIKSGVAEMVSKSDLSAEDGQIIQDFVDRVHPRLLQDVGFSSTTGAGGVEGAFDFATSVVEVTAQAVKNGEVKRTAIHEIWHSLSRFLPDEKVAIVKADFEKARAAAIQADPDLARKLETGEALGRENYRFKSIDEWWAEELTDASLKNIERYSPQTRGIIARGKVIFKEMISAVRAKFGYKRTQAMMNDFFNGKIDVKARNYDLEGKYSKRLSAGEVPHSTPLKRLGFEDSDIEEFTKVLKQNREEAADFDANGVLDEWLKGKQDRLNLRFMSSQEDAAYVARSFEDLRRSVMEETTPGLSPVSFEEQGAAASIQVQELLGNENPQMTQAAVLRRAGESISEAVTSVLAARDVLTSSRSATAEAASKLLAEGGDSTDGFAELLDRINFDNVLQAEIAGTQAELGRGLGALRKQANAVGDLPITGLEGAARDNFDDILNSSGGREKLKGLAQDIVTAWGNGGIEGAISSGKILQAAKSNRFVGVLTEYFINSILSGGQTQSINVASGLMVSLYRPLETMLGAGGQALFRGIGGGQASPFITEFKQAFNEFVNVISEYTGTALDVMGLGTKLSEGTQSVPQLAWKAARQGENILDVRGRISDTTGNQKAISADNFNIDPDSPAGAIVNGIGTIVNIPSNVLRGTDEYIKGTAYRARAKSVLQRQALSQGLEAKDLTDFIQSGLDKLTKDGQFYSQETLYFRGVEVAKSQGIEGAAAQKKFAKQWALDNFDPELGAIAQIARKEARDVTFSNPLDRNAPYLEGVSASIQNMVRRHPLMRMFLPFIQTPTNIALEAARRFNPMNASNSLGKLDPDAALKINDAAQRLAFEINGGDARAKSEALGRLATGVGVIASVGGMAGSGIITGRGPSDPEQRKLLQSQGWQEYSIKVGDRWVSYSRMDPFATMLGTVADITEYGKYAPPGDNSMAFDATMATAIAMANNFTNKTYLQGIQSFVDAAGAPDQKMEAFMKRYASAAIPNFTSQNIIGPGEDSMKDVRTIWDAIIRKVPGMSDNVESLRNVLGEKVKPKDGFADGDNYILEGFNPVRASTIKNDAIANEFRNLGHGFDRPGSTLMGGAIDLAEIQSSKGQSAYDRYQELHGEVRIGNKSLRQALTKLIKSRQYQRTSAESTSDIDSPRIQMLNTVLRRYRRKAQRQLFQEFPEVDSQNRLLRQQRLLARRGS